MIPLIIPLVRASVLCLETQNSQGHAFWTSTTEAVRHNPQQLWRSVNLLLGRDRQSASTAVTVDDFNQFFADKVDSVRAKTIDASEPTYSPVP
jgi:hypothetical protein